MQGWLYRVPFPPLHIHGNGTPDCADLPLTQLGNLPGKERGKRHLGVV